MSITTLNGVLAGFQQARPFTKSVTPTLVAGRPHSLWYLGGNPGAGLSPSLTTAGGEVLSSSSALVNGQIPHYDPVSGNAYLARLQAMATIAGTLILADRLLQCGANSSGTAINETLTTSQTINTTTLPARDAAGTTNGDGVLWGVEVVTATGSGTPTITIGYTNQAGTAGRSATNAQATVASSAIGAFYPLGMQAGDTGIRSIQTYQQNVTWTSGQVALVAYRELCRLELTNNNLPNAIDAITGGFQRIFNGTVPFLIFIPNTTTASIISGSYIESQG